MTPEEKMLERFAREKLKSHKKTSMFDLEDDDDAGEGFLTHGGKSLTFDDEQAIEDFAEDDLDSDTGSDISVREYQRLKRVRALAAEEDAEAGEPDRKKTKKEVMDEIIAKSKMHKYERQAAKEVDEDLRTELDKELHNIQHLMSKNLSKRPIQQEIQGPTVAGIERKAFERNFDIEVKKLALDKRAQPADRTKTEEEKAENESKRLKELEEKRQKRMRGEHVSDSEDEEKEKPQNDFDEHMDGSEDEFGLGEGIKAKPTATELGFDDEDDFIIDDNLVASGSDLESIDTEDSDSEAEAESEDDDEFTKGLLNEEEARNPVFELNFQDSTARSTAIKKGDENGLPYTFPCPQTSQEFQIITENFPRESLPTIVQRIRALYHPKLDSKNKERLAKFSEALVDFVALPWDADVSPPFSVLESLIRHIHSLAKMFPVEISHRFRQNIEDISASRPLALQSGDLVLLTAIGSIYPTSDHFHQVVTPSMLAAARYLGQKVPRDLFDHTVGVYLSILTLHYQQLSKRYVPEVLNFILNTICALSPVEPLVKIGNFPLHGSPAPIRLRSTSKAEPRRLALSDCLHNNLTDKKAAILKVSILNTSLQVCEAAADLWTGKSAFSETFSQVIDVMKHLSSDACRSHLPASLGDRADKLQAKLERMVTVASLARRPLELHHHRPLAIKTFIPKFEETFDPDKHYDPDRERAELAKLKKEHKKERKGAMRELRKDANFMARENLRVKKAKDEAYEKKYKRLVAEIQSEEGREANNYEREKNARKRDKDKKR